VPVPPFALNVTVNDCAGVEKDAPVVVAVSPVDDVITNVGVYVVLADNETD
jgi:hypothetical protein